MTAIVYDEEITVSKEERQQSAGQYVKFSAIGDTYAGTYVDSWERTGNYGPETNYKFKGDDGEFTITAPADLKQKLEKAKAAGKLAEGTPVRMKYEQNILLGNDKSMKSIRVQLGRAQQAAAPKPQTEDVPF